MPSIPQEILAGQQVLTTHLSSRQLRDQWSQKIKDEALFSARTTQKAYVEDLKKRLLQVASRDVDPKRAEEILQGSLRNLGYTPQMGFPQDNGIIPPASPGAITDLSSSRRIQIILDTNVKKARSLGQMAASSDPVFLATNPAWRLTRTGARKKPRGDWRDRWAKAGASVAWKGASKREMVALKDSPIWQALGEGVGGYDDAIGSPYPPFAFGSGLAWVNVGRNEWKRICETEGIEVVMPRSPTTPGTEDVETVDGDTPQTPKKDLPSYADNPEFQAKLRQVLGKMKEARERREASQEGQVSTIRPLNPESYPYDKQKASQAVKTVAECRQQVQKRLRYLRTIRERYLQTAKAELIKLSSENGNVNTTREMRLVERYIDDLKASVVALDGDDLKLQTYVDRLNGEYRGKPQMLDLYVSAAKRMAKRADDVYASENAKDVSSLIEQVKERIRTQGEDKDRLHKEVLDAWNKAMAIDLDKHDALEKRFMALGGESNDPKYKEYFDAVAEVGGLYDSVEQINIVDKDVAFGEMKVWQKMINDLTSKNAKLEELYDEFKKYVESVGENKTRNDAEDWSVSVPTTPVIRKPKTPEQTQAIQTIVNSLPDSSRTYLSHSYDDADEHVVKTISDNNVRVIADLTPKKAWCAPSGVVHISRRNGSWGNNPTTLHHETGHSILFKFGQRTTDPIKIELAPIWQTARQEAEEFCLKVFGEDWENRTKRRNESDWYRVIAEKVFGVSRTEYYRLNDAQRSRYANFCDMLGAVFKGKRFYGHSANYYNEGPAYGLHELVANATALLCDSGLLGKGRTIFPRTLDLIERMLFNKKD